MNSHDSRSCNALFFMKHNSRYLSVISAIPRLWHVNCGQLYENGCYGYESANNENAAGDSRLRRSYPKASPASATWAVPHSIAFARRPHHRNSKETDHRGRYARLPRYSSSGQDHSFARDTHSQGCSRSQNRRASFATGVGRSLQSLASRGRDFVPPARRLSRVLALGRLLI